MSAEYTTVLFKNSKLDHGFASEAKCDRIQQFIFGVAVQHIAIGAGGQGFDSRAVKTYIVSPTARHCCVPQVLTRGDGPRHSLYASA